MQLDKGEKGFSFSKEGPLDMRMDPKASLDAKQVVNEWSEEELGEIFREYGEEPRWRRAARVIIEARRKKPIETTGQLSDLIATSLGKTGKKKLHPATLIFQALRICVNGELEAIREALPKAISFLRPFGRMGVMSFHRLEDGIAKAILKQAAQLPVKRMKEVGKKPLLRLLNKKPVRATFEEVRKNRRARSALLRFAEKI